MTQQRANATDAGSDVLDLVQSSLTVDLIMTERDDLCTCFRDETASSVVARNTGHYSFLPVEDKEKRILGLFHAEQYFERAAPTQQIGNDYEPFSEGMVIGADASIIDFIRGADKQTVRLVVSGDSVKGIVTIWDLQKLPVRAALFSFLTLLELTMSELIEDTWKGKNSLGWMESLKDGRKQVINGNIQNADENDSFVSGILFTFLWEKAKVVVENQLIDGSDSDLIKDFKAICDLRNDIAHAKNYADSLSAVSKTCETVRTMYRIKQKLVDSIKNTD